ncbi:HET-domain-containing protein [Xylariaceae sp. AK1471]|nr:HET-domain-containing protein [Xylariaceae sp. AK1471]
MDSPPESPTDEAVYDKDTLEEKIENLLQVEVIKGLAGYRFLPEDRITQLLTKQTIRRVLETSEVVPTERLINFAFTKARRIFLTLVYIDCVAGLEDFEAQRFHDEHLPLGKQDERNSQGRKSAVLGSLNETTDTLKPGFRPTFESLDRFRLKSFLEFQWCFLAPIFGGSSFYRTFHPRRRLPFIRLEEGLHREGHFSSVDQVEIHKAHRDPQTFCDVLVAVKRFRENSDHFHRELETLQIIRNLNDPHLIKPIAAYQRGSQQCFLFPWAKGGNLRDYWRKAQTPLGPQIVRDEELISWTLLQMRGLCHCLKLLWDLNCRHGDLKPENILHAGGRGNFLIADVGLSKIHNDTTENRNISSSMKYGTRRYEAPEIYMDSGKPISRDYDIWSMGVLLLEWLVWLVYGNDKSGMQKLSLINKFAHFWEISKKTFQVAEAAQTLMEEMESILARETALGELLELIRTRLLVIALVGDHGRLEMGRAKASELSRRMHEIYERAEREPSYRFDQKVWLRRTPSESGPTLDLPERPRQPRGLGAASTSDNSDRVYLGKSGHDNIPSISVELVDSTPSLQQLPLPPDEYNNRETNKLNDTWESKADNIFARKVFDQINWETLKPRATETTICESCKTMNVWAAGFRVHYKMPELKATSKACDICNLLYESLLQNGVGAAHEGELVRVESTFKMNSTGKPIISLYCDPELRGNPPAFAQLGLPQLPAAGGFEQLTLLREWLNNCDKAHKCRPRRRSSSVAKMPTRLIKIGGDIGLELRLVETHNSFDQRYIALSHCWGTMPKGLEFFTDKDNLERHKKNIEFQKLPRTFQDAVTITRDLGIKYIWIDSLCIIQEDQDDWENEAGKMEDVFSSAYCTIAASSARSCLEGFIHDRQPRPCIAVKDQAGGEVYYCKNIDDFHGDVETGVLNQRGWVLQERALSRRTIHFTSNQIYWECGEGVHCETLAKLRNSKAEFLGDSDFPQSALKYFRDGRIVLFQTLYEMYSRLAFTLTTDRSMGILGLERKLARTLESKGDYGILQRYLQRSLMWQREGKGELTPITYSEDRCVPSWSWMAYTGAIKYMAAPFDGVDWNNDDIGVDFETGSLRTSTRNRAGHTRPEIAALARRINTTGGIVDILKRISLDGITVDDPDILLCVVLGIDKPDRLAENERKHYVLIIKPLADKSDDAVYTRAGVGFLLASHVVMDASKRVRIQ